MGDGEYWENNPAGQNQVRGDRLTRETNRAWTGGEAEGT